MSVSAAGRNDRGIQQAVQAELNWDPRLAPAEVATCTTRFNGALWAQDGSTST